jgi:glycosyltransferase involved in cell wall biosynthesis
MTPYLKDNYMAIPSSKNKNISIILPCKNEAENLRIILPILKSLYPNAEILVIDGNSNDNTHHICNQLDVSFVSETKKVGGNGKAVAMRQGALLAKNDTIIFFDADCSHDPRDINKLTVPILNNHYVHVSGSRMLGGSSELFHGFSHLFRLFGSLIINQLISFKFKYRITDAQNGLRAFNKKFFLTLNSKSIHTTIEQELVCLTLSKGMPILELPTHEYSRFHGSSKINVLKHGPNYLYQVLKMIFTFNAARINDNSKNKYTLEWWTIIK